MAFLWDNFDLINTFFKISIKNYPITHIFTVSKKTK